MAVVALEEISPRFGAAVTSNCCQELGRTLPPAGGTEQARDAVRSRPRDSARSRPRVLPAGGPESCTQTVTGSARHDRVARPPPAVRVPARVRLRCAVPALSSWGTVTSAGEVVEVLEAFDLTGSLCDAARLTVCSHHTAARYVAARAAGGQLGKADVRGPDNRSCQPYRRWSSKRPEVPGPSG